MGAISRRRAVSAPSWRSRIDGRHAREPLPLGPRRSRERFEEAAREGEAPVLVTSSNIRPFVHGIVERFRAQTPVLSQGEINPRAAEDCKQH
jgi:hypothetical protein